MNASMRQPDTHQKIVSFLVHSIIEEYRGSIPSQVYANLFSAAATVITPQWIQSEVIRLVKKGLSILKGKEKELSHSLSLRNVSDIIINELTKELPPKFAQFISQNRSEIPDQFDVTSLLDHKILSGITFWGDYYMLFCLFFIYIIPIVLVLLCMQMGKLKWGMIAIGIAGVLSGAIFLIVSLNAYPYISTHVFHSLFASLPAGFSWLSNVIQYLLRDTISMLRTVSVITTLIGCATVALGLLFGRIQLRHEPLHIDDI